MMNFNSFTVANDVITIFTRNDGTTVAFSCRQIKLLKAIVYSSLVEISSKGVVNYVCIETIL